MKKQGGMPTSCPPVPASLAGFTIISQPFSECWLVGPLQLSFNPLAQASGYTTDRSQNGRSLSSADDNLATSEVQDAAGPGVSRGVTSLDCALGKKQVWHSHVRT